MPEVFYMWIQWIIDYNNDLMGLAMAMDNPCFIGNWNWFIRQPNTLVAKSQSIQTASQQIKVLPWSINIGSINGLDQQTMSSPSTYSRPEDPHQRERVLPLWIFMHLNFIFFKSKLFPHWIESPSLFSVTSSSLKICSHHDLVKLILAIINHA